MLLSALCASAFLRFCILNVIRKTMRKREEEKKRGAWVEYDGRKSQCTHCCTLLGRIGMNKYARPETGGGGVGWVKWKPPKRMFILCNVNGMRTTDVACRIRSVLYGTGEFKLFFIAQRKEITSFSLSLSNRFSGLVLEWKIAKFFGRLIEISRSLQNQKKKKNPFGKSHYSVVKVPTRSSLFTRIASHLDLPAIQCSRQTYQISKLSRRSSPNDLCNDCFFKGLPMLQTMAQTQRQQKVFEIVLACVDCINHTMCLCMGIQLVLVGWANSIFFFDRKRHGFSKKKTASGWFVREIDVANWLVNLLCASVSDQFFFLDLIWCF